jgi:signal transduction histidine kinase
MHLRLKTKITLLIVLMVLAVVGVSSWFYLATFTKQVVSQVAIRAGLVSQQIFFQAQNAMSDAASNGQLPKSNSPEDLNAYVRQAMEESSGLTSLIDAEAGIPTVYEVTIVDHQGNALISSDASLPGHAVLPRQPLSQLVNASFLHQLRAIEGPPQTYDVTFPFVLGPPGHQVPFGEIRVAAQTGLLRNEINPALQSAGLLALASVLLSVLLAAVVSSGLLHPVERISAQLDRISRGEFEEKPLESTDEFGQVSSKISQIGQQLRGVREIFSTLRENLDQILGGLEDGLLLFTRDGRAVMVSPAVEHFLGIPADELLGRRAGEIFPPRHPLSNALGLSGDEFEPVVAAEIDLPGAKPGTPPQRVGISVQVITEGGTRMGALVTLRDLESIDRIGRQLQVSERLSAMARVTAGVAHEVKNPLNSMRIWLENLKENLSTDDELPRQAVAVLDSEIDRLDSVVRRFLDFMRAPDLRLEETHLDALFTEIIGITKPQMERAGVKLETQFGELPAMRIDRALLQQALLNLVFNAIDAMPQGGTLTLGLERNGDLAEIRVSDTGKGIAPEHRDRIFQLFFTTRPGGNGIGLASAYKAVQLQYGTIDFESELGRGTTFRIELPLTRPIETALGRARQITGAVAGNT